MAAMSIEDCRKLTHQAYTLLLVLFIASVARGQSSSFTYQGRLTDGGSAATGNYDLQFALWDSASGGAQIGSTLTLNTVAVSNGAFTVSLDFGASSFNGANRFLEIGARPSSGGAFTILSPRQQVNSTPYSVRSISAANADAATNATTATNATQLGGIAAGQYVQTNDSRLSDARIPAPGSANYIQNTTNPQASTNFNISGDGTAGGTLSGNVVSASTGFNIGSTRLLAMSGIGGFFGSNVFVGTNAGLSTTPDAGGNGSGNDFFGRNAGASNTTGVVNSFFGDLAGTSNVTGAHNSFFGGSAGQKNGSGGSNTFLGSAAGSNNQNGSGNTFVGFSAGTGNVIGIQHTLIGAGANVGSDGLSNSTAIGHNARVDQSNSLVLGSIKNVNGAAADTSVGIGTTTPQAKFHVAGDVRVDGVITLFSLGTASSTQATLCRNQSSQIAFCNSSSLRYKANVANFTSGMNIINRLRPISFTWKQDGTQDIGFGAEEVQKVAPLFTFRNDKGEIEGVRYDRLGVLFVNAFKEQQTQIEKQQTLIKQQHAVLEQQQQELKAVKKLVCRSHRKAAVCK